MRILNKKYWPVMVKIDYNDETNSDAIVWCREHLGQDKFRIIDYATFYFQTEQDATMFSLKWSQ